MMSNAVASEDYAQIVESFYERSPRAAEQLVPLIPNQADLNAEFKCELQRLVPGVELAPVKRRSQRYLTIDTDPDRLFTRHRVYAKITLDGSDVESRNVDVIRGAFLGAVRKVAAVVASDVERTRASWSPPPGASVDWLGPLASEQNPVVLRCYGGLPTMMRALDEHDLRIYIDMCSDAVFAVMGGYYFVTPIGEEVVDE